MRAPAFIDHVTVKGADHETSRLFYQRALAPLGVTSSEITSLDSQLPEAVFGPPGAEEFHAAAVAAGGTDNGAPGVRSKYHPHYYGAFVLDPDGNNVEAVCHEAPQ